MIKSISKPALSPEVEGSTDQEKNKTMKLTLNEEIYDLLWNTIVTRGPGKVGERPLPFCKPSPREL